MKIRLFFHFLLLVVFGNGQTTQWATGIPYSSYITWQTHIVHDHQGNVFIAGGNHDDRNSVFIVKVDSSGHILWDKLFPSYRQVRSLAVDKNDNLYASINGKSGEYFDKYDAAGNLTWSKKISYRPVFAEHTDANDNLVVSGQFFGTLTLENNVTLKADSVYGYSYLLGKYNTDGQCLWAYANDGGDEVQVNNKGTILSRIKYTEERKSFGQGTKKVTFGADGRGLSIIAMYEPNGDLRWANSHWWMRNAALDEFDGVYTVTHTWEWQDNKIVPTNDVLIEKYNPSGNGFWQLQAPLIHLDNWYKSDLKCDQRGNVFFTGGFSGNMMIWDNVNRINERKFSSNQMATFILKLDTGGRVGWVTTSKGSGTCHSKVMTINEAGAIFIVGEIDGNNTFESKPIVHTGVFVAKYLNNSNDVTSIQDHFVPIISIHPNPGSVFSVSTPQKKGSLLKVLNVTGAVVHQQIIEDDTAILNLNHLSPGAYFVQVGRETKTIIIQ
jgi:hypothetical protein